MRLGIEAVPPTKKVVILNPFVGICHMQVCAHKDATDQEILDTCNKENPSGTSNGWGRVIRQPEDCSDAKFLPIGCADNKDRVHYLVVC